MTELDLDALEAELALWEDITEGERYSGYEVSPSDYRALIAKAREVERLTAERDAAVARANALDEHYKYEQQYLCEARAERDALKAALEWYEKHVGNCRKNTSEGDASRRELDRDCGTNARAALGALTTVKPEITTTSAK